LTSFIALAISVIAVGEAYSAEVFINIERKKGEAIRMAITDFTFRDGKTKREGMRKLGYEADKIIAFDIKFSGNFELIDNREMIKDITASETKKGMVDWEEWKNLGADTVVYGEYYYNPSGDMVVEGRVFDVERKEQIIGTRFIGTENVFRKMVHKLSDQIVYRFTGENGISETRITYTTRFNGFKELVVADYDGRNMKQITNDKSIILFPKWAPGGEKILFTSYIHKNPDLYSIDLVKNIRRVVSRKIGINASGTWSPDGSSMVFSMSTRGNSDLFSVDADGSNLKRLTKDRSIETSPSFSPDGKMIAYVSDFSGSPQVYIMDAEGENKRRFTFQGTYNADPAWSPRGDMIAFCGIMDNNFNLHVKRVDGRFEKQLTIYQKDNESPSWSPDGNHIAFISTRSGSSQVYIMNATGENQRQITSHKGEAFGVDWSPRTKE
jgi:TolB protein